MDDDQLGLQPYSKLRTKNPLPIQDQSYPIFYTISQNKPHQKVWRAYPSQRHMGAAPY